ncbi:hypothetical protein ACHQM5_023135 [Ranunculus cassubicifolius]
MFHFIFFWFHLIEATKCRGNNHEQFPEGGLFVPASNGIWDNEAAFEVVDVCKRNPCPATRLQSKRAFNCNSKIPEARINIEYVQ